MSAEDLRTLETVMRDQVDDMLADILEERRRTVAMESESDSEDSFDEKYLPHSSGSGVGVDKENGDVDVDGDNDNVDGDNDNDNEEDIDGDNDEKDIEKDIDKTIEDTAKDASADNTTSQPVDEEEKCRNLDTKHTCSETDDKPAESRFVHMNSEDIGAILGMSMESIMGEEEVENLTNAFLQEAAPAPAEKKEKKSGFWCR